MRMLRTAVHCPPLLLGLAAMLVLAACSPDDAKQRRTGGGGKPCRSAAGNADDASKKPPRSRLDTQQPLDVEGGNALAAPVTYMHATIRARHRMEDKLYIVEAKAAIKAYDAMEGRLPKSLDELQNWLKKDGSGLSVPKRGGKYHYDPKSGDIFIYDPEDE